MVQEHTRTNANILIVFYKFWLPCCLAALLPGCLDAWLSGRHAQRMLEIWAHKAGCREGQGGRPRMPAENAGLYSCHMV